MSPILATRMSTSPWFRWAHRFWQAPAIVAVMVSVAQAHASLAGWIAVVSAVVVAHLIMWFAMYFSLVLSRLLGTGGIMLLTKIMGLLLAAIATQLVMGGIFDFIAEAAI